MLVKWSSPRSVLSSGRSCGLQQIKSEKYSVWDYGGLRGMFYSRNINLKLQANLDDSEGERGRWREVRGDDSF